MLLVLLLMYLAALEVHYQFEALLRFYQLREERLCDLFRQTLCRFLVMSNQLVNEKGTLRSGAELRFA